MFSLSIMVGSAQWRLLFKTKEEMAVALTDLARGSNGGFCALQDSYGQTATLLRSSIHGWMAEDMAGSKLASVALALHEARVRNEATKAAQTDPQLRAAQMNQGPSVITPMGSRF